MDDVIYRQAAIDALTTECSWTIYDEHGQLTPNGEEILGTLKKIPSAQQWIPCSERLPNQNGKYLVVGRQKAINILKFDGGRWYGKWGVVAWMPLPEPYKGDE